MWLDDTEHGANVLLESIPSLKALKEDPCHLIMRVTRTIPDEVAVKCKCPFSWHVAILLM